MNQDSNYGTNNARKGHTRRSFLARAGAGTGAAVSAHVWLSNTAKANPSGGRPTLVIINQRGGADGLSICAPVNDPEYTSKRTANTRIMPPGSPTDRAWLEYDTFAMGPGGVDPQGMDWLTPYHAGHLGFVHGVGLTNQSRSHFAAMAAMERGIDPVTGVNPGTGWAARHLQSTTSLGSQVRAFGHGNLLPTVLLGGPLTSAIADVASLALPVPGPYGNSLTQGFVEQLQEGYTKHSYLGGDFGGTTFVGTNRQAAAEAAQATFDTIDLFGSVDFSSPSPAPYPVTPFGTALRNTAKIIKEAQSAPNSDLCVEVIHLNIGGWDHHKVMDPIGTTGRMYQLTQELSQAIGAFYEEFGGANGTHEEYLMMVYTEFGRQTMENDSAGTDHGTGSVMALMGKGVSVGPGGGIGGTVFRLGDQSSVFGPSVADAVETRVDIRDVYAEALQNQLNLPSTASIFPGYSPVLHGIIRS